MDYELLFDHKILKSLWLLFNDTMLEGKTNRWPNDFDTCDRFALDQL